MATAEQSTVELKDLFPEEIAAALAVPAFRGKQLFGWLHRRLVTDVAAMTDLPVAMRDALAQQAKITALETVQAVAAPDGTVKYLFRLADGQTIETVYIPETTRATVCVSTMVGCPFGCTFCATGQSGFVRNLTAAEIVDQVYRVQAALPPERRVTNVVYMGMGEPLANYEAVVRSVRLLIHPQGLNIGQRHITLSTVGLPPAIDRLSEEGLQVNLALSLHAPTQLGRRRLLPIARKYPLDEVMAATRRYVRRTGRKATIEYTVVPGENDRPEDADALTALLRGLQAMVNVIPLNPTEGLPAGMRADRQTLRQAAESFTALLKARQVEAALRKSRGDAVGGACGQLRLRRRP